METNKEQVASKGLCIYTSVYAISKDRRKECQLLWLLEPSGATKGKVM